MPQTLFDEDPDFVASLLQENDESATAVGDASRIGVSDGRPRCVWCGNQMTARRRDKRFCSRRCRQSAFRIRQRSLTVAHAGKVLRFGYADPPYPGFAKKLYGKEPTYGGEVDHAELVASLLERYDGWALSTGAYALRAVLPLCPPNVRICAWVKPIGVSSRTQGLHNTWEPLIVSPGRRLAPGKRDWFSAQPARGGGNLIGRKPLAFCAFLFDALGMLQGDSLDDLFPGTGIVARAWREVSRAGTSDANKKTSGA